MANSLASSSINLPRSTTAGSHVKNQVESFNKILNKQSDNMSELSGVTSASKYMHHHHDNGSNNNGGGRGGSNASRINGILSPSMSSMVGSRIDTRHDIDNSSCKMPSSNHAGMYSHSKPPNMSSGASNIGGTRRYNGGSASSTAGGNYNKKRNSKFLHNYEEFDDTELFVQRQFDQVDRNKDGFLTVDEVAASIRNLGFNETEAVDFIRTFDRNSDGRVTMNEFRDSLASYSMVDYENMKYHYFFKKLDTDGNGKLNIREIRDFLALIGHNSEIPVIKDFIKSVSNGSTNENVDEETFIRFIKQEIGGY